MTAAFLAELGFMHFPGTPKPATIIIKRIIESVKSYQKWLYRQSRKAAGGQAIQARSTPRTVRRNAPACRRAGRPGCSALVDEASNLQSLEGQLHAAESRLRSTAAAIAKVEGEVATLEQKLSSSVTVSRVKPLLRAFVNLPLTWRNPSQQLPRRHAKLPRSQVPSQPTSPGHR